MLLACSNNFPILLICGTFWILLELIFVWQSSNRQSNASFLDARGLELWHSFSFSLRQIVWLFFSFWLSIKVHSCGWLNCSGGIRDIFTKVSVSQTRTTGENVHFRDASAKTRRRRLFIKSSVEVSRKVSFSHQHFKLDYRLEVCHLQSCTLSASWA